MSLASLIVGADDASAADLRRRLATVGIECPPTGALTLERGLNALKQAARPPEVVFLALDGFREAARHGGLLVGELRRVTPAKIVPVGTLRDPQFVLSLIREGAFDCVHVGEGFDDQIAAIRQRIRDVQTDGAPLGNLISVVSAAGGCGASTVAVNLAAALVQRQISCGLIDFQVRGGDLANILNCRPQHTLLDLCRDMPQLDREIILKSLIDHSSGVRLLAAPPLLNDIGPFFHDHLAQALQLTRSICSCVIADLEDVFHQEQLAAVKASQALLLVLRLDFPCLLRVRRILAFLTAEGIPLDRIHLVANRHGEKNQLPPRKVAAALELPISHYLPDDYPTVASALNLGRPVVCERPTSRLAKAYRELAEALVGLDDKE